MEGLNLPGQDTNTEEMEEGEIKVETASTRKENTKDVEKVYSASSSIVSSITTESSPTTELEMTQEISEKVEVRADGIAVCRVCGKTAGGKRARDIIEYHVKSHQEGLSFNCQDCGKQFSSKSSLKSHISRLINQLA